MAGTRLRRQARGLLRGKGAIEVTLIPPDTLAALRRVSKLADDLEDELAGVIEEGAVELVLDIKKVWPLPGSAGWKEPTGFSRDQWVARPGRGPFQWIVENLASYAGFVHKPGQTITWFDEAVVPLIERAQLDIAAKLVAAIRKVRTEAEARVNVGSLQRTRTSLLGRAASVFGRIRSAIGI